MDFVTSLPILANWKGDSYDSILIIVDWLLKMVYYEPIKVTIDRPGLREVIINMVIHYYGVLESIVTDQGLLFISKFWSSLCYFLEIKKKLFKTFHPQKDSQIERQNNTMEVYLRALSIGSKIIGQSYCQWRNLLIIMPKMPIPVTPYLNSIVTTIPEFFSKKMLTPAQDLALLTN